MALRIIPVLLCCLIAAMALPALTNIDYEEQIRIIKLNNGGKESTVKLTNLDEDEDEDEDRDYAAKIGKNGDEREMQVEDEEADSSKDENRCIFFTVAAYFDCCSACATVKYSSNYTCTAYGGFLNLCTYGPVRCNTYSG